VLTEGLGLGVAHDALRFEVPAGDAPLGVQCEDGMILTSDAVITDPGMEPDRVPSDAPTRFIGRDDCGVLQLLPNLLIGGLQTLAGPQHHLG
jgi:hypothetical protein